MTSLTIQLPKTLCDQLASLAEQEGVSLNQYIVCALSRQVGMGYDIQPVPAEAVAEQQASYAALVQSLGRASADEVAEALAEREEIEPKLQSDVRNLPFDTDEIAEICRRNDVDRLCVFGSVARGETTPDSDVDFLVRFAKPKSLLTIIGLEEQIEAIVGRPVDLLTEAALSPYIRESVVQDLVVVYEAA